MIPVDPWTALAILSYIGYSTWDSLNKSETIGELEAKYEQAKEDADICGDYKSRTTEQSATDIDTKLAVNAAIQQAKREYDANRKLSLEQTSELCDITPVGDNINGLLSDQERFLEELRKSGLYLRQK